MVGVCPLIHVDPSFTADINIGKVFPSRQPGLSLGQFYPSLKTPPLQLYPSVPNERRTDL